MDWTFARLDKNRSPRRKTCFVQWFLRNKIIDGKNWNEPPFAFPKNWIWICPPLWFNSEIQGFLRSETRRRRGERATKCSSIFKMSELVAITERSSNLFRAKIARMIWNPVPAFPPAETRRAKQNNFLFNSLIFRATLFLLKGIENCFALMFGLMPNSGNASHPTAPTAQNRRAKIPSPQPPSFSPAWLDGQNFLRADGGTSIWVAGD